MVGGSEAAFEKARPLFELMGKNITRVGENGDGQTTKVANQIIVALTIEAVSEALVFASKAGADPAKVRAALMGGFASSRILEVHGERLLKRNFQPGFRINLHQKDLGLALENARALGVALPNTATCQELFNACAANGLAKSDHSAMVCALELLANHQIRTPDLFLAAYRRSSENLSPRNEGQRKVRLLVKLSRRRARMAHRVSSCAGANFAKLGTVPNTASAADTAIRNPLQIERSARTVILAENKVVCLDMLSSV